MTLSELISRDNRFDNSYRFKSHDIFINFVQKINKEGMISEFVPLREDEREILLDAPILVSILIAGADGNIDEQEKRKAIDIAQTKQSRAREQLSDYYNLVGERFEDRFYKLIEELPKDTEARTDRLCIELRKLNFILPKVDIKFGIKLHASLKDLAKKIAEASGGVLGYLSVSYEEAKLMKLEMLKEPVA